MSYRKQVLVCVGPDCEDSGAKLLKDNLEKIIKDKGLKNEVKVAKTGCFGCSRTKGPMIKILPERTLYIGVEYNDLTRIVEDDLINNKRVEDLLYRDPKTNELKQSIEDVDFNKKQIKIVTRNAGSIDPEKLEDYIEKDGYLALGKCLTQMSREEVIAEIKESGLRGRGGGGFPTGLKWEFAYKSPGEKKYVVCNADEGDPGAFMDRSVLEGDPHSVLEAMAVCGYAIGSDEGYIYIRAEYPLAIERLENAIAQAKEAGLLGEKILGTDFNFNIQLRLGAGAFVCGEETSLIHSMEGERGEPTSKPPFPAASGFWGKPTNVNNVETYANIPVIINRGAKWFKSIGTEKSSGTKVFALAGKVNNVGLVEVPMGTTLREVIFEMGGGITGGKKFKAVQTGGPSGGCLDEGDLDTPIDFDNLIERGSMMGSGGMIVMDEDDCMVSVARFYLDFTVEESCGKCTPCRIGTKRLSEILNKITNGNGTLEDIDKLKDLGVVIGDTALCGLGQTASNPVLSTMKKFNEEYMAHVIDKKCPAGQCTALLQYTVTPDKCIGCTACARVCPVNAISGKVKEKHVINQETCIKCGACESACKFAAIFKG